MSQCVISRQGRQRTRSNRPEFTVPVRSTVQQGLEGGNLVALVGDLALGQDATGVVHRDEQGDVGDGSPSLAEPLEHDGRPVATPGGHPLEASRQLLPTRRQIWFFLVARALAGSQVHWWIRAPAAVETLLTSTHLPLCTATSW